MGHRLRIGRRDAGFTLIELVVVLFIVGLLAAIAVPSVSGALVRAREAALIENLSVMRRAIDDYRGDLGLYPPDLGTLAEARYISIVPDDPVAGEDVDWLVIEDQDEGGVRDVRSAATGVGTNGVAYREW
ncbi:type II secretion system protein [Yoonia sediminilitoris]|nr:prepilin-type N-terminal cleavage/methylation domain-containing protein [Yoonia sediminilitoris]